MSQPSPTRRTPSGPPAPAGRGDLPAICPGANGLAPTTPPLPQALPADPVSVGLSSWWHYSLSLTAARPRFGGEGQG
jgi:hypothetical protein